jgi:DNA gyrase subunit B
MTEERPQARTSSEYTAQDIQVLGGLEAVRRRPGMYIGSTDQRGLQHLVHEIVYNSVDEAMAGFCNKIIVTLMSDNVIQVEDNGSGIPVDIHPVTNKSALETVMTTLHAGGKFGGKHYQVSGGLHGVGASAVNALSEWLRVDVKRDGKVYRQEYRRGVPQEDVRAVGEARDARDTGTITTFLADDQIFGDARYDVEALTQRLREIAYLNKGLEITLTDQNKDTELTSSCSKAASPATCVTSTGTGRSSTARRSMFRSLLRESRSRAHCSTTTVLPRTFSPLPTASTLRTAAPT